MEWRDFASWSSVAANWAVQYHQSIRDESVLSRVQPGEIASQIPIAPPELPEGMGQIMDDFMEIILPGITHWQHPRFFGYFPANITPPSALAEMLTSIMGAQCMLWQTSPAATELELAMVDWLRQAVDLPTAYKGVIQDSASSATLAAVLTMRERATGFRGNKEGIANHREMRIYCSEQVHSSVDRACWIAGIGQDNLVKLPTCGEYHGMNPTTLKRAIHEDRQAGKIPAGLIAVTGSTNIGACDDLHAVGSVAASEGLYSHLDAAWAGSAMICPEFRNRFWPGVDTFDSIVLNPHKWLGAHFDCSVQFLKDMGQQMNALKIEPEYLKTQIEGATNLSELSIQLGRRFRALKLWFLIRTYGLSSLRNRIRNHVIWAEEMSNILRKDSNIEIVTNPILSLFSFRQKNNGLEDIFSKQEVDGGRNFFVTKSVFNNEPIIRLQIGQFDTTWSDVLHTANLLTASVAER